MLQLKDYTNSLSVSPYDSVSFYRANVNNICEILSKKKKKKQ